MRLVTGTVLLIFLMGCAVKPHIVEVPIVVKTAVPPVITRPVLPISMLDKDASAGVQIGAWGATVEVLQGYATYLETLLDGYR